MQSRTHYKHGANDLPALAAALLTCVFGHLDCSTARAEMTEIS